MGIWMTVSLRHRNAGRILRGVQETVRTDDTVLRERHLSMLQLMWGFVQIRWVFNVLMARPAGRFYLLNYGRGDYRAPIRFTTQAQDVCVRRGWSSFRIKFQRKGVGCRCRLDDRCIRRIGREG